MELTGQMSELRENAEYLVWYVKKPVFTKKKNFKGSFQVISKSVVVVNITYTMDWDSLLFNTAILIAGVFVLNYGADKFIDHTVHLSNSHCPFDY